MLRQAKKRSRSSARPGGSEWVTAMTVAIQAGDAVAAHELGRVHPEARGVAAVFETLAAALPASDHSRATDLLMWVHRSGYEPATDAAFQSLLGKARIQVQVAEGVSAELPIDRVALTLLLAELLQTQNQRDAALQVLTSSPVNALSVAAEVDLLAQERRWQDVMSRTDGIALDSPSSAHLHLCRAEALAATGSLAEALDGLDRVLQRRLPAALRHRALLQRAGFRLARGDRSEAAKDVSSILREDPSHSRARLLEARLRSTP